jgi:ATP-dependent DNA ligase
MGRLPARRQHREAQRHALLTQRVGRERQLQTDRLGAREGQHDCVIDGELVAFDAHGISRFQLLQNALRTTTNLHYCVFDLMALDCKDLRTLPLIDRKERLQAILPKDPLLIYSEHWAERGKKLFKGPLPQASLFGPR